MVKAPDYPEFIKQFSYKDNADAIFKAINARVEKDLKNNLLEALGSQRRSDREKATKIWYEECATVAKSLLDKYNLADHIAKVAEEDGNDDRLREQLKKLVERAGPWMQHNETTLGNHPQDQLTVYQYLIYPKGADTIKKTFEEMEAADTFNSVVKNTPGAKTTYVEGKFGQSIVRLSMVHCYSLEVLDFLSSERAADLQMQREEERYASGTLRTIFKDNVTQPYLDPLEPRITGQEIVMNPNGYDAYLTWFMLAHVFGVLKRNYDPMTSSHTWSIEHTERSLDGSVLAKTDELPPEGKIIRMNQPEQGKLSSQEYSLQADRWSQSHERADAAIKLGCFIVETPSFKEAVTTAQTKVWNEGGAATYREMLLAYEKGVLNELDENDQRFLRAIVTRQVNDLPA